MPLDYLPLDSLQESTSLCIWMAYEQSRSELLLQGAVGLPMRVAELGAWKPSANRVVRPGKYPSGEIAVW